MIKNALDKQVDSIIAEIERSGLLSPPAGSGLSEQKYVSQLRSAIALGIKNYRPQRRAPALARFIQ